MSRNDRSYLNNFIPYGIAAAVLSLCGGITAAVPPNIVADWSLPETMVTWLALAYSLGAAVAAPIMGKLSDIIGRRATLLLGLAFFTVGPLLSALTPTGAVLLLILFRLLTILPVLHMQILHSIQSGQPESIIKSK